MSSKIEFTNLVENEVFDDEAAFPPAPPLQRPTAFASPVQQQEQPPLSLPTVEGTPLRDTRLKLAHRTEGLRTIVLAFGVFSFGLTVALAIELFTGAPPVAPHGGVTSSSELCSNIGTDQLKKGGSAVDAAISVMLCIGVVRPQSAGLGGGGLMLIHNHKTHNTTLLDYRETAPGKLQTTDQESLRKGGLSVGVPGELAGMRKAHAAFGQLPWSDLFTPVIKLAEDGWMLDDKDEVDLRRRGDDLRVNNENYVRFRQTFMPGASQTKVHRKDLANLLRKLASDSDPVQLFYSGSIANEIVDTVEKSGGVMSLDDLRNYATQERPPILATFGNFKIVTFSAPSSGSLLIYMLNELENVKKEDVGNADYYAKVAEITSRAYKCRALLGDPDDAQVFIHEQLLTNKTINVDTYCDAATAKMPGDDRGTSHVNVIDNDEIMVAATSSLNHWFGSMLMTPSGILLNNEMDDFDVTPDPNKVTPGKRPLSSMIPTIVYHGTRDCWQRMTIGGTNGTKIPSSIVQTLIHLLVKGDDLQTAVEAPKIFCNNVNCQLENFSTDLLNAQQVAKLVGEQRKLPVTIVDEKLSTVGIVLKNYSTIDAYIEKSSYGKSAVY